MKRFLLIPLLLLSSCGGNTSPDYRNNLEILCKGDDYKVVGRMPSGLLTDSLFYYRHNTLVIRQYWENGCLISTEFRDNDRFRKIKYVSLNYMDEQDTTFIVYPYDIDITNFYYKVKTHNDVEFKANEPSIINIFNIPQEICSMAVAGGIVKWIGDGYSITPTKHKDDTVKVFYLFTLKGWPPEYEAFIIE